MTKVDMRDAFFEKLVESARLDKRIIVLSADHGAHALKKFEEEMPDRYINIGIAEQNMVGVAAGLAASGKIVFIYGISPFVSLRVLEQLTIDVAAMQLPVNVVSVGAGFTYSTDGPTHQGLQDISAVATIPGMTILNSSDPVNTRAFVEMAINSGKPHYIRIEKERLSEFKTYNGTEELMIRGHSKLNDVDSKVLVIATGLLSHLALNIAADFVREYEIDLAVIDLFQIKPLTPNTLAEIANFEKLIVLEESYKSVIASEIALHVLSMNLNISISALACGERFIFRGSSRDDIAHEAGLSRESIFHKIAEILER